MMHRKTFINSALLVLSLLDLIFNTITFFVLKFKTVGVVVL